MNYSSKIKLEDVLTFQGNPYKPISLRFENFEDDLGHVKIKMSELTSGVGTREAAKEQFNTIMNILTEEVKIITLDFKDIKIISSSYADELIAKLMIKLGLFQFNNIIRLQNMNEDVQLVLQRSVMQRMIATYTSKQ
ncbi:MAG: STAS-like domain-containing protein [Muribaculaceae bacterium]|nr:STAS-like domain-containing protein [Muribaculaceae bacterium]